MLAQGIQITILVSGVVGQILVANRNIKGFYWWLICNAALFVVSLQGGMYGMASLYVFYSFMCFYSINKWEKIDTDMKSDIQLIKN